MDLLNFVEIAALAVFIFGGVFVSGWFRILKETNKLLKDQNVELKADNKEWQLKHEDNVKAIAKLQAEVDTMKNVPLKEISEHMAKQTQHISDQTEVNKKLLNFLQTNMATA